MGEERDLKHFVGLAASCMAQNNYQKMKDAWESINNRSFSDDEWLETLKELIVIGSADVLDFCYSMTADKIKWKNTPNGVVEIVRTVMQKPINIKNLETTEWPNQQKVLKSYYKITSKIHDKTEALPAGKKAGAIVAEFLALLVKDYHPYYSACLRDLYELARWNAVGAKEREVFIRHLTAFYKAHPNISWFQADEQDFLTWYLVRALREFLEQLKPNAENKQSVKHVIDLFCWLENRELTNDEGDANEFGHSLQTIASSFLVHHARDSETHEYLKDFIPGSVKWMVKEEKDLEESLKTTQTLLAAFVTQITSSSPHLILDHLNSIIKLYFKNRDFSLCSSIQQAYAEERTRPIIENHVKEFVYMLNEVGNSQQITILELLRQISQNRPKILEPHLGELEQYLSDASTTSGVTNVFVNIARKNPLAFKGRVGKYLETIRQAGQPILQLQMLQLYSDMARINEMETEVAAAAMETEAKVQKEEKSYMATLLHHWATMAQIQPGPLQKRLSYIKELTKNPAFKSQGQHLIDVLEGRSLQKVSHALEEQQENLQELDEKVDELDENVSELDKRVDDQGQDIFRANENISQTGAQLDDLEYRVDEAEEDIVELDSRTVSNAPSWTKDVSRLLNPRTNNDWRLIGQRLGYSPSEIRGWATQPDPTMSMLADFYTAHRTSEASHFLLSVLRETNRHDAARIVEKSLKDVEHTVRDKPQKYRKPPPVFLSYQWGHQESVKLLKAQLQREGFGCWLDIGQMGGGDSLYQAIDEGIRSAKVVVLCMSEKYCKSANCIREVNLTNGLGKRVIPIQMEKIAWPPPGSLGPILAEKLFIRFYRRDNEKNGNLTPWPTEKYHELVDQIKEVVEPDEMLMKEAFASNGSKSLNSEFETKSLVKVADIKANGFQAPRHSILKNSRFHVILSCSPDKLYEMQNLQRRLEQFGYKAKAISYTENSSFEYSSGVLIAAVSLRYTKSNLATHEINSSVGSGKPVIPLLMDPIRYPPEGGATAAFQQLEPINCSHMRSRADWSNESPELAELIRRLETVLPEVQSAQQQVPKSTRRSSIPLAKDHVRSSEKPLPSDPLAREATEIRIQVRPPTPQNRDNSYIPLPKSKRVTFSDQNLAANSDSEEDEEENESSASTDSEVRTAKDMQNSFKLPQIRQQPVTYDRNGRPTYGRGPPLARRNSFPRTSQDKEEKPQAPVRASFFNSDRPKLPSVYRLRFVRS